LRPARFLPLVFLCLLSPAAAADDWPRLLFKETSHDFGTVARGAVAEYRFQMVNPYLEDVHIKSVGSSCGCTKPAVTKQLLKTYESGEIVATLDTRRFLGQKDATFEVEFDQPFPAKFQLKLTSYIRADVVFEPGEVQFGSVTQGQSVRKRVTVTYAGRPTWRVAEIGADSAALSVEMTEVDRSFDPNTKVGKVVYELWVTLKDDAPSGYFKHFVILRTDDPNQQTARIPLTVEGLVVPSLTVNPAVIMLDVVRSGESVSRNVVLRGQKPFKVVEVQGPDPRFRFRFPDTAKPYQVIAVEFQAGDRPGKLSGKIRIKTDLPGTGAVEVSVDGQVAPSASKTDRPPPSAAKSPAGR
jgi:hypothetical protein